MSRTFARVLLCCALTWTGACGGDGAGSGGTVDGGPVDGGPGPTPDAAVPTWAFADVHGLPNLDDDDASGGTDWAQPLFATDDDLATLTLPAANLALVPAGGDIALSLTGAVATTRLFRGGVHVLGAELGGGPVALAPAAGQDVVLQIEFGAYAAAATLTLAARDSAGTAVETTTAQLQAAPLIMNHHLQPAEKVWLVAVTGNEDMVAAYQEVLGAAVTVVPGAAVGDDVWMQDEFEFATLAGEGSQRTDVVIDSIRNRGLDAYGDDLARVGPSDAYAQTWGNPQARTTYDSFGNLEASPPVTVGGVAYPFGKIYYGRTGTAGMSTTLGTFLAAQKVQAPFTVPTSWLCVGHVDEFSSFVPDPTAPKGFRLLMADTDAAWAVIDGLSASAMLPLYGESHGYATVGALRTDTSLRALNADVQADYLDPITETFKTQLGLTDADIIKVPSLFETVSGCNGRVAALIPGMVNLIVANVDGATTHVLTADPFFRAVTDQAVDPIIAAFKAALPASLELHFVDDWDTYHLALGEVHCGTNVRRTPAGTWWTSAQHLLGGL